MDENEDAETVKAVRQMDTMACPECGGVMLKMGKWFCESCDHEMKLKR